MKYILIISLFLLSLYSSGQIKIPVTKIYNHSLTGVEGALIDEQNVYPGVPTGSISYWDSYPIWLTNKTLVVRNDFGYNHVLRTSALPPWGFQYTAKFNGNYNITKISIFIEPFANTGGKIVFRTGNMYNNSPIDSLIDTGLSAQWYEFNTNVNSNSINLKIDDNIIIREIVFWGNLNSLETEPIIQKNTHKPPIDSIINVNLINGMGRSSDNQNYAEYFPMGRWFMADYYLRNPTTYQLYHYSGTANQLEMDLVNQLKNAGNSVYFAFGSMVSADMVTPTNNSGGDWASQKPIPTSLGDEVNGQRYNGILTFNEIAHLPFYYAKAAYNLRDYAKRFKQYMNMLYLEPDNERDGNFKGAGYMYPQQLAAMISVYYDGHGGTITFNGDSVGIINTGITLVSPALAYMNPVYIEEMILWWETNRASFSEVIPKFIFSGHAYSGTLEVQFNGTGQAVSPESNIYNLSGKLDTFSYYAAKLGTRAWNTETGYDDCNSFNSFMNIQSFGTKTVEEIHGDWVARNILMHSSKGIEVFYFWLNDLQYRYQSCYTFTQSGLLYYDQGQPFPPLLKPRKAYTYLNTLKTRLQGYSFKEEVKSGIVIKQGIVIKHLYQKNSDTTKKAWVIWCSTQNQSVQNTSISIGSSSGNKIVNLDNTETLLNVSNPIILSEETPKIVMFTSNNIIVSQNNKIRKKYITIRKL